MVSYTIIVKMNENHPHILTPENRVEYDAWLKLFREAGAIVTSKAYGDAVYGRVNITMEAY